MLLICYAPKSCQNWSKQAKLCKLESYKNTYKVHAYRVRTSDKKITGKNNSANQISKSSVVSNSQQNFQFANKVQLSQKIALFIFPQIFLEVHPSKQNCTQVTFSVILFRILLSQNGSFHTLLFYISIHPSLHHTTHFTRCICSLHIHTRWYTSMQVSHQTKKIYSKVHVPYLHQI